MHQEGAQQLLCGHRFDLCSQVDVSSYHQGRSPEAQDPTGQLNVTDAIQGCRNKHLPTHYQCAFITQIHI